MGKKHSISARKKLIDVATDTFREQGYTLTTLDQICSRAEVTKGAFFHHFPSKEQLGVACLENWGQLAEQVEARICNEGSESLGGDADPVDVLFFFLDSVIAMFGDAKLLKSCAAGTLIQEVHSSSELMKSAVHECFQDAQLRLKTLLDAAAERQQKSLDTTSISSLWIATMQGSMTLLKASGDDSVVARNLQQVRHYIATLLAIASPRTAPKG